VDPLEIDEHPDHDRSRRGGHEESAPKKRRLARGALDYAPAVVLGDRLAAVERFHQDPPPSETDLGDEVPGQGDSPSLEAGRPGDIDEHDGEAQRDPRGAGATPV